jgi:hypothetical protein
MGYTVVTDAGEPFAVDEEGNAWDLFEAAYAVRVDLVRDLLAAGADANARATPPHRWISAAREPTPLNCAICAWRYTGELLEVVRLLLAHGARVDETHWSDFLAESVMDAAGNGAQIQRLLEARLAR